MATAKKTTAAKKAPAKSTTRTRAPRKAAKIIRNLRGTVVHARLRSVSPKDPFGIELKPRGTQGDTTVIPVALQDDPTFLQGLGVLFEEITQTEFKAIQQTYGPVGYLGRTDAPKIERPADTTIMTADDWDGKGKRVPNERNIQRKGEPPRTDGTGMNLTDFAGSDTGLHEMLREAQKQADQGSTALPEGVDLQSRRVQVERVKG